MQTVERISLILFGAGMSLLVFTTILTYLPRDNDFRGLLTWLGLLVGFSFVFFGIPMLLGSLVTGVVAIFKNRKQRTGYIILAGNLILGIGTLVWLFR